MKTREQAIKYGLTFPDTYKDIPFHDPNWVLIRVKGSKKAFLWTYERNGYINLNVKVNPEWRDFWRKTYKSVTPGYHQNKEHWNTITSPQRSAEHWAAISMPPAANCEESIQKGTDLPEGSVLP